MRKRILASLLTLVMILSLTPMTALAVEPCTETEGCTLEAGHEGDCVTTPDEPETPEDGDESNYYETDDVTDPADPSVEEQLAALVAALPNLADISPTGGAQVEAVYNQISAIYAFAEENGLGDRENGLNDAALNAAVNAVIAALNPVEMLASGQIISTNTTWNTATTLTEDLTVNSGVTLTIGAQVTISGNVTISGGGTIKRGNEYKGVLFEVPSSAALTVSNVTIDGGAIYSEADSSKEQQTTVGYDCQSDDTVTGVKSNGSLIRVNGGSLVMESGAVLQNNFIENSETNKPYSDPDGNFGAGVGVINGGSFVMNGGMITRQVAAGGSAVYCQGSGSSFVLKDGEITKNFSGYGGSGGGAAVRIYAATFTMNGGKISYNASHNNTALALQGDSTVFTMTGGEICYNYGAGSNYGTIMATSGSGIKVDLLGGQIHHNKSHIGAAIVTYGDTALTISGTCEIDHNTKGSMNGANIIQVGDTTGTLTISGTAKIHDNETASIISIAGTGTLSGNAEIYANKSAISNGCAGISVSGSLLMTDSAVIRDNVAAGAAVAGVYLTNQATMTMSGGTITGNKAYKTADNGDISYTGGIRLGSSSSKLYLSGSAAVYGNTSSVVESYETLAAKKDNSGKDKTYDSNINLDSVGSCYVSGELTTNQSIGIMHSGKNTTTADNTVVVNSTEDHTITQADFEKFVFNGISKNAGKAIYLDSTNKQIKTGTKKTIIFNANMGDSSETATQEIVSEKAAVLNANPFTRTGYTFQNWSTQKSGGDNTYDDKANITTSDDVTLYAQWTKVDSISITADSSSVTYGTPITLTANPAIDGWTYHWFKVDGENETALENETGKTLTLKNVSDSGSYKVKLTPDGDSDAISSDAVQVTIGKATPTIRISANKTSPISGATIVTLTVSGAPTTEGTVNVTCDVTGVTVNPNADGTFSVTLPNETKDYNFTASYTAKENGNYNNAASAACKVSVTRYTSGGGGGGSSSSSYAVTVDSTKNGTVTVSPKNASKGTTVTITVKPNSGYELDDLTVTDKNGDAVKLTRKSDTQYTFTMPASRVTVEAAFAEIVAEPDVSFIDVPANAYYYDAVAWAVENSITNGTSATTFSPEETCTRAQTVTFLWRAAGSPAPRSSVNPFTDVQPGAYYYEAVLWAVENGITNGTSDTTFSPDDTVTRGQTVTFQHRAAGSPAASGGTFADVAADAYYASAVQWAVANGITNGTSNTTFSPDDPCTRGQIVTFLYRDMAE